MTCDLDDDDIARLYKSQMRTARKEHKCSECRGPILKGENYEYVSGLWQSSFRTFKTCDRCLDIRDYTLSHTPCVNWSHGGLILDCHEKIEQYQDELPGMMFGLLRLIVKAKNHGKKATP